MLTQDVKKKEGVLPRRDTRAAILQAAEDVGRRVGLARVTTKEVAAAAQCSEASIYYHFENRDDLLAELVAARFKELDAAVSNFRVTDRNPPPSERLTALVTVVMEAFLDLIGLSAPLFADPTVLARFREVLTERSISPHGIRAAVAAQLREQQRQGHLRDDVEVDTVALLMVGACHEVALEAHLMGTAHDFPSAAAAQQIASTLAALLARS